MKRAFLGKTYLPLIALTLGLSTAYAEEKPNVAPLHPLEIERTLELQSGETLSQMLNRAGFTNRKALAISHPLQKKVKLTRLRPGDEITVTYAEEQGKPTHFKSVAFVAPGDKIAKVEAENGTFIAKIEQRKLERRRSVAVGEIQGSLFMSAKRANMPAALVPAFANLFAYELDFTRDIQAGDAFRVVFEEVLDEKGQYVRSGNILAAELVARGKTRSAYRFKDPFGKYDYYDAKGTPKRKLLLRTPLEFTRISSHYNLKRMHPILKYTKAHKGTDFAAPTGTPVKAAGSGKITRLLYNGGYGKYIKIQHNKKYATAYAHLHNYARGMKVGTRVKQGQVIGYVGSTGRSTGPHLHYEVHVNGKQVDPMRARLPAGNPLKGNQRNQFQRLVADFQSKWQTAEQTQLAQANKTQKDS